MIYITSDNSIFNEDKLQQMPLDKVAIVILDESSQRYPVERFSNILMGSILLPPYEALVQVTEGNYQLFYQMYYDYLKCIECDEFITMIVAAWMLKGKDVILYYNEQESDLNIHVGLIQYLSEYFGIQIGYLGFQTMILEPRSRILMDIFCRFYMYDIITEQDLFLQSPKDVPLNGIVIPKLIEMMRPKIEDKTYAGYEKYFNELLQKSRNRGAFVEPALREMC